jgi:hypothetical protein
MAANKRTPTERERDREEIAKRVLAGHTQRAIGLALNLSQGQICRDLKTVMAVWRERAATSIGDLKARELAEADAITREAWAGWKASVDAKAASSRFLRVALQASERRSKLLGLDAPARSEVEFHDETPPSKDDMPLDFDRAIELLKEELRRDAAEEVRRGNGVEPVPAGERQP